VRRPFRPNLINQRSWIMTIVRSLRKPALARLISSTLLTASIVVIPMHGQSDSGLTRRPPAAGGPIDGVVGNEGKAFTEGLDAFQEVNSVNGTLSEDIGLGPRFNLDSCGGCHAQPAVGGSSPAVNPQIAAATRAGAQNTIPWFISPNGPVREARFIRDSNGRPDGGVAALFTIRGRSDAEGCNIAQPDFSSAAARSNVAFRIPTPLFGTGLIEAIDDSTILANKAASAGLKASLGIAGHENRSGNDGTIARFGWKAQNKSLMIFAAEAYNVEQGVTSDLFTQERDSTPGCRSNATPEDHMDVNSATLADATGDIMKFTMFMRLLAPPARGPSNNSVANGEALFNSLGCSLCHTPSLRTSSHPIAALSNKTANLFSDLLVHRMGSGLADGISQGAAGPDEFRTAPLWGVGQRLFFLHDGRATDLLAAIQAHSGDGSEANGVLAQFNALKVPQKQDILDFLRSL
jgi:CxxC motif-containing protein (DUF1111 family)